jgi:hypothetical protein
MAPVTPNAPSRALLTCGETQELSFRRFDAGEVFCDVVVAAALARDQPEPALREGLGCTHAAEVSHRGQFPFVLRTRLRGWAAGKNPFEIRRLTLLA